MAYNLFLMLGMMYPEGGVATTTNESPSGQQGGTSLSKSNTGIDVARRDTPHTVEKAGDNLKTQLKQQASSGLSDHVKSILGNKAIIARSDSSASSILSENNINTKAEQEIKLVQDALIKLGKLKAEDINYGQYDQTTAEAVKSYQQEKHKKDTGFLVDGIVGFQTLNSLLRDVATELVRGDPNALKDSDNKDLQGPLIAKIDAAWGQGGSEADAKVRAVDNSPPSVAITPSPTVESPQVEQGPAAKLAKEFEKFSSLSGEDKKKWMRGALNLYANQRNNRWITGFNWLHSKLKTVDIETGDFKNLLGDFLHNNPKSKLNINSDLGALAEHINGMVIKPGAEKELKEAKAKKESDDLKAKIEVQKSALGGNWPIGNELGTQIVNDLVMMYQRNCIRTPVTYGVDPNSKTIITAISEFQSTMVPPPDKIGAIDARTVDALRAKAERLATT